MTDGAASEDVEGAADDELPPHPPEQTNRAAEAEEPLGSRSIFRVPTP